MTAPLTAARLQIRRKPVPISPDYTLEFVAFPILRDDAGALRMGGYYDMAAIREGLRAVPELTAEEVAYVHSQAAAAGYDVEECSI